MAEPFENTIFDFFFNDSEKISCITTHNGDVLKSNGAWEKLWSKLGSSANSNNILNLINQVNFDTQWVSLIEGNNDVIQYGYQLDSKIIAIDWTLKRFDEYVLVSGKYFSGSDNIPNQIINQIIDNSILGTAVINKSGRFIYANKVFCDSLGYSTFNSLTQRNIFEVDKSLSGNDSDEKWALYINDNSAGTTILNSEFIRKDGSTFLVELTIVCTKESKADETIILYVKDITKERERDLYINRLYNSLDYSSDAIYWGDMKDLYFQYVNKGACNMLGYSKEEFRRLSIYDIDIDFVENDTRIDLSDFFSTKENKSFTFEARHRKKNGEIIQVDVNVLYLWINGDSYVLSFVRDISERKKYEKAILKNQKFLTESQRMAKIGNFELSYRDNSLMWSDEVYSLFGYEKDELELDFDLFKKLMPPEDYLDLKNILKDLSVDKSFYEHEHIGIKKNGDLFYAFVRGYVERNRNNEIDHVYGVIQDITEQKELENRLIRAKEKAEQSDRLKSAFLANVSHEIRTPMNAIIGFSSFLKDEDNTREDLVRFADIIINSGEHLLLLINDIIDISKIDTGQVDIIKTHVNLNTLLDDVQAFFSSFLLTKNKTNIDLIFDHPDSDIAVFTDEMRLKQILINLISNAVKFTDKGFIKILCKKKDSFLHFDIIDSGIGISKEKINVIFERFQQGSSTTEKVYGGTGLGLAIAKACVNLLGGDIKVSSEEGKGSHFYFSIKI